MHQAPSRHLARSGSAPKRPLRQVVASAGAACVLGVTACGGGASSDPQKTAQNWLQAFGSGDDKAVCSMSLGRQEAVLKSGSPEFAECTSALDKAAARIPEPGRKQFQNATISNMQTNGDTSRASRADIAGVHDSPISEITCRLKDGRWYVDLTSTDIAAYSVL